MALYGFYEPEEKDMFRRLLTVTRVGPKLALAVLSLLTPSDVAGAIVTNNAAAFDRVSGMGRKTAQRVLLELKERVEASEMLGGHGLPAELVARLPESTDGNPLFVRELVRMLVEEGVVRRDGDVADGHEVDTVEFGDRVEVIAADTPAPEQGESDRPVARNRRDGHVALRSEVGSGDTTSPVRV